MPWCGISKPTPASDEEAMQSLDALLQSHGISDPEAIHSLADKFLCDLLRSLGYVMTVDYFESLEKWYS